MNCIGVVASDGERKSILKWYEFWKRDRAEYFYIESYDLVLVVAYLSQNIEKIFQREGVCRAVRTKSVNNLDSYVNIEFADGKKLFKSLLPEIIGKVIKISGISKTNSTFAIIDENLDSDTENLIEKFYGDFRNIILVTNNTVKAKSISEKMLDEYGLTIVTSAVNSKVKCDIAVKIGSGDAQLPKHTILIDASFEHNKTNKNVTINWVELDKTIELPFAFDSLEIAECIEKVCGIELIHRLNGFKCGGNLVSISKHTKKK